MVKAIVFDMDGVIFDSERCVLECWKELAKEHGISGIEPVFLQCTGTNAAKTKEIVLSHYGQDFPYDTFKVQSSVMFRERYDHGQLPLKPGVRELMEYLKKENYQIGLATSTREASAIPEIADAGLLGYFDRTICGDMVEKSKPDPDIYLKACAALGIDPSEAVAIEDSYNGVRSAKNGGLHCIMVPDLIPPDDEMRSMADVILTDLGEVPAYLESLQDEASPM